MYFHHNDRMLLPHVLFLWLLPLLHLYKTVTLFRSLCLIKERGYYTTRCAETRRILVRSLPCVTLFAVQASLWVWHRPAILHHCGHQLGSLELQCRFLQALTVHRPTPPWDLMCCTLPATSVLTVTFICSAQRCTQQYFLPCWWILFYY